jgi:hypothetical protein
MNSKATFDSKPQDVRDERGVTIFFKQFTRYTWVSLGAKTHSAEVDPNHRASEHMLSMIHERPHSLIEDNPSSG